MIYLTGDVHSKNFGHWEQKQVESEVISAEKYLDILKKHNLSCTIFINGECLVNEKQGVKRILEYNIELGGHTYNNFGKMNIFRSYINRKLFRGIYGSRRYQIKDIRKTKEEFEKFGLKMTSWRTHSFGSNKETFKLLEKVGVKYVSDLVGETKPFEEKNIIHIPINIPVDVTTVSYGLLCPENRDPFASCTKGRIKPEEWFEIIKKRVIDNERGGIPSILLIHPVTMEIMDNFRLFEKIVEFLSAYKSAKISEFKL